MTLKKVDVTTNKNGLPILQIEHNGNMLSVHSKYDPIKEADRILDKYQDIEKYDHVIFYGGGLGYHIKRFFERYPAKLASVYEPFQEVYEGFQSFSKKLNIPLHYLENIIVEQPGNILAQLSGLSSSAHQRILLIILPAYEKVAEQNLKQFKKALKDTLQSKTSNTYTEMKFAKRWTLNALMNAKVISETTDILSLKKNPFEGKPVILASAGPSLHEEMDNLRLIKEKGLAYIFAVGSANKALITQGILPDAVLTYDPQAHNQEVFKQLIEQKIDKIPMIFGSTVGYETLQAYKGPKFYFLTSQDTVNPYFLEKKSKVLIDAPSIAILTLQLLHHLKAGKIILVGQNFAFKNGLFYSKEIKRYDKEKQEIAGAQVQQDDIVNSYEIDDTRGGKVKTNKSFDHMRLEMEFYIEQFKGPSILNTTKGGAAIKGTVFQPLDQVMKEILLEKVVDPEWFCSEQVTFSTFSPQRIQTLRKDARLFIKQYESIMTHFKVMKSTSQLSNPKKIQKWLEKFDGLFQKFVRNALYQISVRPITRVYFEKLQSETKVIRLMEPTREKVERVVSSYTAYLEICRNVYGDIAPIIQSVILPELNINSSWKEYISTSGVFHYENEWEKSPLISREQGTLIPQIYTNGVQTKQQGAIVKFQFNGSKLKLFGTNHSGKPLKLKVTIDGKEKNIVINEAVDFNQFGSHQRQEIFRNLHLSENRHEVMVEVLTEEPNFLFQGVEIDLNERAFHIHEVTSVKELEVGKRIRCHYKAAYNTIGEFSGLGKDTTKYLPIEAYANPEGDFYFIMVDDIDGKKKLIADRVIQHSISWEVINQELYNTQFREKSLNRYIKLPSGGINKDDQDNDWSKYIEGHKEMQWGFSEGLTSWCANYADEKQNHVVFRGKFLRSDGWCGEDINSWFCSAKLNNSYPVNGFRPLLEIDNFMQESSDCFKK